MGRHRVAIVVLRGTFVLDLAVAVQAFGRRPRSSPRSATRPSRRTRCHLRRTRPPRPRSASASASWASTRRSRRRHRPGPRDGVRARPAARRAARGAEDGARGRCPDGVAVRRARSCSARRACSTVTASPPTGRWPASSGPRSRARTWSSTRCTSTTARCSPRAACSPRPTCACTCWPATMGSRTPTTSPGCWSARRTGSADRLSTRRRSGPPPTGPLAPGAGLAGGEHRGAVRVEDVAARAHMSQRTLVRRFRAETGEGLAEWVARRRIERARALLEDTDLPVAQVAHDAGFGSVEALRRHFQARVGTSPRAYRDTFRAQPDVAARSARLSAGWRLNRRDTARTAAAGDVARREDHHLVAAGRDRDDLALRHVGQAVATQCRSRPTHISPGWSRCGSRPAGGTRSGRSRGTVR